MFQTSNFTFHLKKFLSHHFYPNPNKTKERKENVAKAVENSFFGPQENNPDVLLFCWRSRKN